VRRAALLALAALAVARRQDLARWWIAATGTVVRVERGPSPTGAAGTTPRVPPAPPPPDATADPPHPVTPPTPADPPGPDRPGSTTDVADGP